MAKGTFKAKMVMGADSEGKPISGLRTSKTKGTPEFFGLFSVTEEGAMKGKRFPWDGWLTDSTEARTLEALLLCGLENDDLSNPVGLDKNEVLIVVDEEPYVADVEKVDPQSGETIIVKETRYSSRVQWVNDPARSASVHKPMETTEASAFAARFQGSIMAARQKRGLPAPKGDGARFDFGANVPPGAPAATPPAPAAAPPSAEAQQASPKSGF